MRFKESKNKREAISIIRNKEIMHKVCKYNPKNIFVNHTSIFFTLKIGQPTRSRES